MSVHEILVNSRGAAAEGHEVVSAWPHCGCCLWAPQSPQSQLLDSNWEILWLGRKVYQTLQLCLGHDGHPVNNLAFVVQSDCHFAIQICEGSMFT